MNRSLYYGHQYDRAAADFEVEARPVDEWKHYLEENPEQKCACWEATWAGSARAPIEWPSSVRLLEADQAQFQAVPLPAPEQIRKVSTNAWQEEFPEYGHELTYIKNL